MKTLPEQGVVYLLHAPSLELVKIGFVKKKSGLAARMLGLRCAIPVRVELTAACLGTQDLERRLHWHFEAYRVEGEWFKKTPEIETIEKSMNAGFRLDWEANRWRWIRGNAIGQELFRAQRLMIPKGAPRPTFLEERIGFEAPPETPHRKRSRPAGARNFRPAYQEPDPPSASDIIAAGVTLTDHFNRIAHE
jgi:hypothetical protein